MYYDTGVDIAGLDLYVGTGLDDPTHHSFPFFAQAELIKDYQKGQIRLSAKGTATHGAVAIGMGAGMHYLASKSVLDAQLFRLGGRYGMRYMIRAGITHAVIHTAPIVVPTVIAVGGATLYEKHVNEPVRKSSGGSRGTWFGPFASGFGTVV